METRRYRVIVEYDGTGFHGFQRQASGRTVQGELERALQGVTAQTVRVLAAGRTDAGVHARGQVVAFDTAWRHGVDELERALNAVTPHDIALRRLETVVESFHPRFSAVSRTYFYNVYESQTRIPVLERHYCWQSRALDLMKMNQAAHMLLGVRDMAAFGQPTQGHVTIRHVMQSYWRPVQVSALVRDARMLQFVVEANAFLRGMARRIVGCLLAVGEGRLSPEAFGEVIAARDIARAEPPAAARGLVLWQVRYQDEYPDGWLGASG